MKNKSSIFKFTLIFKAMRQFWQLTIIICEYRCIQFENQKFTKKLILIKLVNKTVRFFRSGV